MQFKFVLNVKYLCQLHRKLLLNTKLNRSTGTYRYYKVSHCIYKTHLRSLSLNAAPQKAKDSTLQESKTGHVEDWGEIAGRWYIKYQQFVGIAEVLEAQEQVTLFTNQLFEVQSKRRQLQKDVESVHQQLLSTHQRITKSELYSEDHYSLFEKARELNGNLKSLQSEFLSTEEQERSLFTQLTTAIKYCHEKERTQSEQSKYWSIFISIISASLAALITSINNWVRIKEIKDHATSLHKDALAKWDELYTYILSAGALGSSSSQADSDPKRASFPPEAFLKSIQSTVRDELTRTNYASGASPGAKRESSEYHSPFQEPSYPMILGSMAAGAALGIGITAFFLGPSGGPG